MALITQRMHAVLDYASVAILMAAPKLFGFADNQDAATVMWVAAALVLTLSLLTNYPGGLIRTVPMAGHLFMDVVLGVGLAASPWIFGFSDSVYLPHVLLGAFAFLAGLLTTRRTANVRP